jgi:YidC/Oxa1 family membrane protein insertase
MEQKPAFDKNTLLLIVFCVSIWWLWQQHLQQKYPEATNVAPAPATSVAEKKAEPQLNASSEKNPVKEIEGQAVNGPESFWPYEDQNWKVTVSSKGGRIVETELKGFTDRQGDQVKLLTKDSPGYLGLTVDDSRGASSLDSKLDYKINSTSKEVVVLSAQTASKTIKKTLTFVPDKYLVKIQIEIFDESKDLKRIGVGIIEKAPLASEDKGSSFFGSRAGQDLQEYFFSHGTKTSRKTVTQKDSVDEAFDQTQFASLGSRYFTTLLFNRGGVLPQAKAYRESTNSVLQFNYPVLDKSAPQVIDFDLYMGPKSVNQLSQVDESASKAVDFGFFSAIAFPLLLLMKWLFSIFRNYGVAIVVLTILVRTITFPFTYMSYKSMKSMQLIQPQIARLKETYKDNTAALNQEMMKLMKVNKVNPMGGCLPMLLQLPVFWALYQVLQNSIELYHAPFFGWIHDLSVKDPYFVLPVLMGIGMFIQQKITPNTMDPAQARVMMIMPVLFSFLMVSLPSGLTLYIFVSTLFGILQQAFMMRGPAKGTVVVQASR